MYGTLTITNPQVNVAQGPRPEFVASSQIDHTFSHAKLSVVRVHLSFTTIAIVNACAPHAARPPEEIRAY